ncbi:MAG: hypothetical protein O2890_08025 [Cyanobacteria bacterium]|nr:hypothetical protein [Cyanobacteriota bacterium]
MAATPSRFKVLRYLVLCAGFAVSSPVSVMAQIANLEPSEAADPPEANGLDA